MSLLALVGLQSPAQAAVTSWASLYNNATGNVMAIKGGTGATAGADVIQWPPAAYTNPQDQYWGRDYSVFPQNSANTYFALRTAGTANQFALSVDGNSSANGAKLVQWWFKFDNMFEQWSIARVVTVNGSTVVQYQNRGTGKCIALQGGSTAPAGAPLIQFTCGSGPDQLWKTRS
ncbi:RICIN domain-containing protein [Actinoplanes sp. NPDC049548]|uniref:RICIN domain-containing protein n=1 Tax=Actinoplanes sp. NPDC049548 TaxID=3155152 RepID=UPI003436066C